MPANKVWTGVLGGLKAWSIPFQFSATSYKG